MQFDIKQLEGSATAGQVLTSQGTGLPPIWGAGGGSNIYDADGTLAGNRVVTQAGNVLNFNDGIFTAGATSAGSRLVVDPTNDGRLRYTNGANTNQVFVNAAEARLEAVRAGGTASYVAKNLRLDLVLPAGADFSVNNNPGVSGEVLQSQGPGLPPIWAAGGGSNIYTTDGTITASRTLELDDERLTFLDTPTGSEYYFQPGRVTLNPITPGVGDGSFTLLPISASMLVSRSVGGAASLNLSGGTLAGNTTASLGVNFGGDGANIQVRGDGFTLSCNTSGTGNAVIDQLPLTGLQLRPRSGTVSARLTLFENTVNGTNATVLAAANALTADTSFVLPSTNGVSGQALLTDGSGNTSWGSPAASVPSRGVSNAYAGTLTTSLVGGTLAVTGTTDWSTISTVPMASFPGGGVLVAGGTGISLGTGSALATLTGPGGYSIDVALPVSHSVANSAVFLQLVDVTNNVVMDRAIATVSPNKPSTITLSTLTQIVSNINLQVRVGSDTTGNVIVHGSRVRISKLA